MKVGDLVSIFPRRRKYNYGVALNLRGKLRILRGFWYGGDPRKRNIQDVENFGKNEGSIGFVRGRARNCRFIRERID